jgi:hypothetical protein
VADKLIIDNRTGRPLTEIWAHLGTVLCQGKLSNEGRQHSYATVFHDGLVVESILNEKSERFLVIQGDPIAPMDVSYDGSQGSGPGISEG